MDRTRIVSIALVLGLIGLGVWFMFQSRTNWNLTLYQQGDEPYGLQSFKEIVKRSAGEENFIDWDSPLSELQDSIDAQSYIFIGSEFYGDSTDAYDLRTFVSNGGKAFLSLRDDSYLYYTLLHWEMWNYNVDFQEYDYKALQSRRADTVLLSLDGDDTLHSQSLFFRNNKSNQFITVFGFHNFFLADSVEILGEAYIVNEGETDTLVNCMSIPIGSKGGELIIHTMPITFSNYFIRSEEGFNYAQSVLSNLNKGELIWDVYNTYPKFQGGGGSGFNDSDELQFIKEKRGFRLAWLTLIFGSFAFLILGLRRKARPIPLIQPPLNRSVGFARSLGALYLKGGKPRYLASEMMRLFDNYNRRKYGITRNLEDRESSLTIISQKTGTDRAVLKRILDKEWELRYNPQVNPKELIPLHKDLQHYYQQLEK